MTWYLFCSILWALGTMLECFRDLGKWSATVIIVGIINLCLFPLIVLVRSIAYLKL